jgi:hypothetical protein
MELPTGEDMMKTFSSSLLALDFALIAQRPIEEAASAISAILDDCEALQEQIETHQTRLFSVLLCASRVATEKELYRLQENPETGFPFTNVDDWLKFCCPKCYRYAQKANKIQAGLPAATLPQLEAIKECNGELLGQYVSSETVKNDPAVIDAAAKMTEAKFRKHLEEKGQHIEKPEIVFKAFPHTKAENIRMAMGIIKKKFEAEGCPVMESIEDTLWHLSVDIIAEEGDDLMDPDEARKEHQEVLA